MNNIIDDEYFDMKKISATSKSKSDLETSLIVIYSEVYKRKDGKYYAIDSYGNGYLLDSDGDLEKDLNSNMLPLIIKNKTPTPRQWFEALSKMNDDRLKTKY